MESDALYNPLHFSWMRNSTLDWTTMLTSFLGKLSLFLIFGVLAGLEITLLCWLRTTDLGASVVVFGLSGLLVMLICAFGYLSE